MQKGAEEKNPIILFEAEREINFREATQSQNNHLREKENPEPLQIIFDVNCAQWVNDMKNGR